LKGPVDVWLTGLVAADTVGALMPQVISTRDIIDTYLDVPAHCLNLLKERDIPQILALFKAARKQWLKEQDGTAGDVDFWQ